MVATPNRLLNAWTPATPHVGAHHGGIAEWLVVVVALIVLVVGILLTGADDTVVEAIGDAWETITGGAS